MFVFSYNYTWYCLDNGNKPGAKVYCSHHCLWVSHLLLLESSDFNYTPIVADNLYLYDSKCLIVGRWRLCLAQLSTLIFSSLNCLIVKTVRRREVTETRLVY